MFNVKNSFDSEQSEKVIPIFEWNISGAWNFCVQHKFLLTNKKSAIGLADTLGEWGLQSQQRTFSPSVQTKKPTTRGLVNGRMFASSEGAPIDKLRVSIT